ncbi:MAG: ExbD/TolR family protein [Alphaproteobacteria bacterium]
MALSLDSSTSRRGRRRGRGRRALSEINMTPMIDVMLVLLIIFMISAPLLTSGVKVELPKTEAGAMAEETEPLNITIRADGAIFLQDAPVPFANLTPALTGLGKAGFDKPIYVRSDGKAAYAVVAQVMAALQTAGFTKIGLITDTGGPSSGGDPEGKAAPAAPEPKSGPLRKSGG